jgi:uncharacterized membrane protein YeaQ/YmgE (transglycosylase-associated protein family)
MTSNILIGFLMGISIGTWVYSKLMNKTGGNTQNAVIGAAVVGFIVLLVVSTLLGLMSE